LVSGHQTRKRTKGMRQAKEGGRGEIQAGFWQKKTEGIRHFEGVGTEWKIILKWILTLWGGGE